MDKHTVIAIIAVAVIIGSVSYSFVNAFSAGSFQIRYYLEDGFDYLALMAGGNIEICNPTPIPVDFKELRIEPFYKERDLGTYYVNGKILDPYESEEFVGDTKQDNAGQFLLSRLSMKLDGKNIATVDLENMRVNTIFVSNILGFIPYSISETYTGEEFNNMMNHEGNFVC